MLKKNIIKIIILTLYGKILFGVRVFYPDLMLGNLNRFMSVSGIIKWFEVTIKGMLSNLLPKFGDIIPTSLGSGAIFTEIYSVMIQQSTALVDLDMYLTSPSQT